MRELTGDQPFAAGTTSTGAADATEFELVREARARSPRAWSEIYDLHYPTIFRYMRVRISDRDMAEDLAATVFVQAIKSIGSYRNRGRPLLAWLYGIARNQVNFYLRTSSRRAEIAPITRPLKYDAAPGGEDPAELIDRWDVRDAIASLSDDQREIIALRYFAGLTTPEAALVMGKKERAVYSLHARALQSLRRRLGEDFAEDVPPGE